jgi:hypothetical protein
MPAPLPVPRVPSGFPPLAAAGGQTACPVGPTTPKTEADGQTVSLGGQTALGTEASGQTVTPGGQTAPPLVQKLAVRPPGPTLLLRCLLRRLQRHPMRRPRLRLRPRFHPRYVRPRRLRFPPHHLRLRCPNPTRVALGLRESHRHRLYISSRHQ